ncbi:MAG: ATP-grasp domain-containing protein [bacterium]|nr:ATP-grasp domain-containing protein [bacterium]
MWFLDWLTGKNDRDDCSSDRPEVRPVAEPEAEEVRVDFRRLAIVNRGEPAMRAIHAVRELEREVDGDTPGLTTIALYTEPDSRSMFVREADEAVLLGPATFVDPRDGGSKSACLDCDRLRQVLTGAEADAVWVGWGFVAEHAAFVDLCDELGIVFVGPSAEVMRRLGDKISSKQLAEEARVPVAPWSGGPVETLEEARRHAAHLGYPLMIKATAGGGGRGIRKVHSESELRSAFERARAEALKAFGGDTVFPERLLAGARHVEVQIIADRYGAAWGLGVRDCTIQRRNQKVLEESPSPALTEEQDEELRAAAVRLAQMVGYHGAGTVEFLYDADSKTFSFMEVNARLQVEHPVTEMTTGTDLVKLQLHVARGGRLEGPPPPARGAAIEVRLNAEDPENAFAPAPGRIDLLRLPTGPGLRIDTGVEAGDSVPAEFDSMIAKVIAWGGDRAEALARLRRALKDTAVVVRGGATNKGFLLDLLHRDEVARGEFDVGWLDRQVVAGEHMSRRHAEIALIEAAISVYEAEVAIEQTRFLASAVGGRPEVSDEVARQVELEIYGRRTKVGTYRLGPQRFRLEIEGHWIDAEREVLGPFERWLTVAGRRYRVLSVVHGPAHLVEVEGAPHRVSRDDGGVVRAPSPAVVVSIPVDEGEDVMEGDRLAVLEAMKMETAVVARFGGTVREILVTPGMQVGPGAALLRVEPRAIGAEGDHARSVGAPRLELDHLEPATVERPRPPDCRQIFAELRCLILGYDVGSNHLKYLMEDRGSLCQTIPPDDSELLVTEEELLTLFVDLCSLFDRQPDHDDLEDAGRLSVSAYLRAYLRDLDAAGAGLPQVFLDKLRRALAHFGVEDLDRRPELEESLWRIYRSQARVDEQVAPILSVLERRLEHLELLATDAGRPFRALLDRLIAETRGRFPAIHDCAREVRFRFFDRAPWQEARDKIYAAAAADFEALAVKDPDEVKRASRLRALVECPQPLKSFISSRFDEAPEVMQRAMLEVLARRYYRLRKPENVRVRQRGCRTLFTADYEYRWKRFHLLATHVEHRDLGAALRALAPLVKECPAHDDVVLDLYVWRTDPVSSHQETRDQVLELLDEVDFGRPVLRVVLAISSPQGGLGMGDVQHLVFRGLDTRSSGTWTRAELMAAGFVEETVYGGLHPMMARRLLIWRLAHFEIERLQPTEEDVYVFRGVARNNPSDERIFALAEVRDLTPVRDDSGRVKELPHLERMYLAALSGIRRFQSQRAPRERLHWNRVLLYLWPTLDLRPDEIHDLANRLAPEAEGLGIEKVVARARMRPASGAAEEPRDTELHIWYRGGQGPTVRFREPADQPIQPLTRHAQKVVRLRRRGLHEPYEVISMMAPERGATRGDFPPGDFREYDLGRDGVLEPVERPPGGNRANVVVGVIRNFTTKAPEGMARVILLGDPGRSMGSLAEAECRRILAALDLAAELRVPLEWFAVSAGARIAMDSGTENMDWIARVLRRLVVFTQGGGEVNVIVPGVNVGAQPYWNAEATMLMHTRGILIMPPEGSMVLTGKQALDYSGGVSAEDNQGIGGYEHIMGPNGQAQYYARDLGEACQILLRYYEHSYVVPGERFPRRAATTDDPERDVSASPHGRRDGTTFQRVGDVFSQERNPGRKKAFDVRQVMAAVIDQDLDPLERWFGMRDAEIGVVWDAHIGGYPVCLLGLESRPLPRLGFIPADGPAQWTSGTLFPQSSKKVARAINAASGNRPVVILANLSGFDGSPESMRGLQLEYGAEIGRAVVNFDGPMVFCVISRYHGGAFVVFSGALNENLEVAALEGSFASVIGGAPAAAVVFARDVRRRAREDPRVAEIEHAIPRAGGAEKVRLQAQLQEVFKTVHAEKLGEVAEEFDRVHSIHRAQRVGSVHHIIAPERLRGYLIEAVERGMRRALESAAVTVAVAAES